MIVITMQENALVGDLINLKGRRINAADWRDIPIGIAAIPLKKGDQIEWSYKDNERQWEGYISADPERLALVSRASI